MARKGLRATPARDRSREDESLLLRSAESLGRMIGSLQRQLDVATRRIVGTRGTADARKPVKAKRSGSKARSGTAARGTATKSAKNARKR
jgi:hypothetical protein